MVQKSDQEKIIEYIEQVIYRPNAAKLDIEEFSEENSRLAEAISAFGDWVISANRLATALSDGRLDYEVKEPRNAFLAPLKTLQSNLRYLTWVAECVASGDYSKRVTYMGGFSSAFNKMIQQLGEHDEQLKRLTCTDSLTGVGNRYYFKVRAKELSDRGKSFTIAFIDIDSLKQCNDKCGHAEGDKYIKSVCELLKSVCGEREEIFRMGGDEFLLLSETATTDQLEDRLEAARTHYMDTYEQTDENVRSFSFGCQVVSPTDDQTTSSYLSEADQKMYRYKSERYVERKLNANRAVLERELDTTGLDGRLFELFAGTTPNRYMFLFNLKTNVSRWSMQAVEDFGLPGEFVYDAQRIWESHIHPDDRKLYQLELEDILRGRKFEHNLEYRVKNKKGDYVVCSSRGYVLQGHGSSPTMFAGTVVNHGIADNIDSVTNLYNVYAFLDRLHSMREKDQAAGFLMIGIDHFNDINNTYSYIAGNAIMRSFAAKLRMLVEGRNSIYRLDGAKFAIVIENYTREYAQRLYDAVRRVAMHEVDINGRNVILNVRGAVLYFREFSFDEGIVYSELCRALDVSKRDSGERLITYDENDNKNIINEMILLDTVKESVMNQYEDFYLVYQIMTDGKRNIIGADALVRWRHDPYGEVPPESFIPFLENDACFYDFGLWILRKALREAKKYTEAISGFCVGVNVSYRQVERDNFLEDVLQCLKEENFPANNLILELTEHCQTLGYELLAQRVNAFRSKGIRVAADDFGKGCSTFSILKKVPFDIIKIAAPFVVDIAGNDHDRVMVEAVMRYAHGLGMKVCAEGVETEEIYSIISQYEPDMCQGFLLSREMPRRSLDELIIANEVKIL